MFATITLAGALFIANTAWKLKRYERAFPRLEFGATKAQVIQEFGKPQATDTCTFESRLIWGDEIIERSDFCIDHFWYSTPPLIGAWVIGFDKEGRAVIKEYLQSP